MKLNEKQQIDYYHLLIEFYDLLAHVYEKQGVYDKALEVAKKSLVYEKRLFDRDNTNIIQDLRTKYSLDQKERTVQQLSLLNEKNKRINILSNIVILLCISIIVLLVIRFRANKKINRNKLQIAELKQQETELTVELQHVKLEEKEKEFQALINETEQRRIKYYLEGLEAERNRLAKNLHDNVSNELAAIKLNLESGKASREDILAVLQNLHEEVRGISHDLIPPVFQYATFSEIVEDYVQQHKRISNIDISVTFEPEGHWADMPHRVSLEIYRIIQESVGNALKHAEASHITIALYQEKNRIRVIISDDGRGFDMQKKPHGIGLRIIKERIESLKGELNIFSEKGTGTKVEVSIPFTPAK